ncbi:hypothetical protein EDC17_107110 [Sphingobacterium alimentarium]|uniref:Antitoxin SocA-like Panacea domain-containing protein n=1 Tax=Sphingobacterium alimentarium TaxID=797292 RepID=A0A4R3VQI3_9SPHI|nr:hypothetical protein [Sphingobacterium alimentarium]TCV05656.1 hypothetical protein EDC17_107110 [Sphingobacterium alimentarium]
MNKNLIFEYFIFKSLLNLTRDSSEFKNDLSILKSIKLLFFFSTISDSTHSPLIDEFETVKALPLGHVITDIYASIKSDNLTFFSFNKNGVSLKSSSINETDFDINIRQAVDPRFDLLLKNNPYILKMTAYELVELSHKWYSWNYYFNIARSNGLSSIEIPIEVIKTERKIYSF